MLDLKTALLPAYRADSDQFLLGLGVVAALDALRLSLVPEPAAIFLWLPVLFFCASAHINRLRDAGRQPGLVIAPLGLAVLAKAVTAVFAVTAGIYPYYLNYLEERGYDPNDPQSLQTALSDDSLMAGFQDWMMTNEELVMTIADGAAWPSMFGFWIVIGLFAIWFSKMGRR